MQLPLRDRFVAHCRIWYKLWSSWLAIAWGIVVTIFWNDPTVLGQVTAVLPDSTRALLSPIVLIFVSSLPIIINLLKQNIKKTP